MEFHKMSRARLQDFHIIHVAIASRRFANFIHKYSWIFCIHGKYKITNQGPPKTNGLFECFHTELSLAPARSLVCPRSIHYSKDLHQPKVNKESTLTLSVAVFRHTIWFVSFLSIYSFLTASYYGVILNATKLALAQTTPRLPPNILQCDWPLNDKQRCSWMAG